MPTVTQNTVHQHVVDKERRRCVVWRGGWGMILAPPESRGYQEPPSVLCMEGGGGLIVALSGRQPLPRRTHLAKICRKQNISVLLFIGISLYDRQITVGNFQNLNFSPKRAQRFFHKLHFCSPYTLQTKTLVNCYSQYALIQYSVLN